MLPFVHRSSIETWQPEMFFSQKEWLPRYQTSAWHEKSTKMDTTSKTQRLINLVRYIALLGKFVFLSTYSLRDDCWPLNFKWNEWFYSTVLCYNIVSDILLMALESFTSLTITFKIRVLPFHYNSKTIEVFHNSSLIRRLQQNKIYQKIRGLTKDLTTITCYSNHYTRMISMLVRGCNWILSMHLWFCPIRLIHPIRCISLHFEKKLVWTTTTLNKPKEKGSNAKLEPIDLLPTALKVTKYKEIILPKSISWFIYIKATDCSWVC